MKVWISKYALSKGIYEQEVEQSESNPQMVTIRQGGWHSFHGCGKDWHLDKDSAQRKAHTMRQNKIVSLSTQISKLQKMTFD